MCLFTKPPATGTRFLPNFLNCRSFWGEPVTTAESWGITMDSLDLIEAGTGRLTGGIDAGDYARFSTKWISSPKL
jgi:hypothetical protein